MDHLCLPARCPVSRMHTTIAAAIVNEDEMRLRSSPPLSCGFVRISPSVAPSGRVRMKAALKSAVCDILVLKYAMATMINAAPKTSAPPSYPNPDVSARKSPRAVPSVLEKRMVTQLKTSTLGVVILPTDPEPVEINHKPNVNMSSTKRIYDSLIYPTPKDRSVKSAIVVPTVVVATIVAQFWFGWFVFCFFFFFVVAFVLLCV